MNAYMRATNTKIYSHTNTCAFSIELKLQQRIRISNIQLKIHRVIHSK